MTVSASPIGICAAAYSLPGDPIDFVPWAHGEDVAPRLIDSLLSHGFRYFHAAPVCSDADFIASAIDKLDAPPGWTRGVRYLVHAHTEAFSMPAPPVSILAELSKRYGFEPTMAFSVTHLACASVISALDCAAQLLARDPDAEYALVVTSDRVFGDAKYRIWAQNCLQSDGASAMLLSREGLRCRLGLASFKHFTQLHAGPSTPALAFMVARDLRHHLTVLLREHEAAAAVPLSDYDQILPFNSDRGDWMRAATALGLAEGTVYLDNVTARAHACCADFAVNLVDRGFERLAAGGVQLVFAHSNVGAYAALTLWPPASPPAAQEGR